MVEGGAGDDYLVLFSATEARATSDRYGIASMLPGYRVVGLRGWDDFIVQDESGATLTLPTVPCDGSGLADYRIPEADTLVPDDRFTGKVKWYITPIKFRGDPNAPRKITWISVSQHADAVRWWNAAYREMTGKGGPAG
jgi:hypothetical protein